MVEEDLIPRMGCRAIAALMLGTLLISAHAGNTAERGGSKGASGWLLAR
jgi:hypothetical protein